MRHPSEDTGGVFRPKSGGKVQISSNSHPATDNFHIDRSRLGTHEDYDPEVKNEWGENGKFVEKPNSIMDNVRSTMGGIGRLGSYKSIHNPVCPSPYTRAGRNPLTTRRGD